MTSQIFNIVEQRTCAKRKYKYLHIYVHRNTPQDKRNKRHMSGEAMTRSRENARDA
jgi:hypothetical protein